MRVQKKVLPLVLAILAASIEVQASPAAEMIKAPQPTNGCFVDRYKTNQMAYQSPETNAVVDLFTDFLNLWKPGDKWDNGTKLNPSVLDQNIATVKRFTQSRSKEQELISYFEERRDQSYSVLDGLGPYTPSYLRYSEAVTSLDKLPADVMTKKYSDKGNGAGNENSVVGDMVRLVNTLRGDYSSGNPSKMYYQYRRPFRWDASIKVDPYLVSAISSKVQSDGGFASGHTNAAYLTSFALAYAYPERYQEMLTRASELGSGRIYAGMHSCLDVMGGRMMGTALSAAILNDRANAQIKQDAYVEAHKYLKADSSYKDRFDDYIRNKSDYLSRLTYGFKQIGDKTKKMTVPKGAEVLLETRLPYLDQNQRRMVLYTTGLPSGYPLLDDPEGWGRLNLFAAADGYGAFIEDVTVNMSAGASGFAAKDVWRNDITGKGGLIKQGTGELGLTGNNRYTGGTKLQGGTLRAMSETSLGTGNVTVMGGTLYEDTQGALDIGGNYAQSPDGTLVLTVAGARDIMKIKGGASVEGRLIVKLAEGWKAADQTLIKYGKKSKGVFRKVELEGVPAGVQVKVVQRDDKVMLDVR